MGAVVAAVACGCMLYVYTRYAKVKGMKCANFSSRRTTTTSAHPDPASWRRLENRQHTPLNDSARVVGRGN